VVGRDLCVSSNGVFAVVMARKMVVHGCFAFPAGVVSGAMVMQWLEMNSRWCGRMDENEGGSRWWCSLVVFAAAAVKIHE